MTDISKVNYISKTTFDQKTQVDTELDFVNIGGSLSMPSNTYDNLTLGASGTTYTAPADGWFVLDIGTTDANQRAGFYDPVLGLSTNVFVPTSGNGIRTFVPAKKGKTYTVTYTAGGTVGQFKFIYAVGSEWEKV